MQRHGRCRGYTADDSNGNESPVDQLIENGGQSRHVHIGVECRCKRCPQQLPHLTQPPGEPAAKKELTVCSKSRAIGKFVTKTPGGRVVKLLANAAMI